MSFAVWMCSEPLPALAPVEGFEVVHVWDAGFMARLQGRTTEEMEDRIAAGHRAYVALLGDEPAAWGWVATRGARIGEVEATFTMPEGDRYLWNFVTLPAFRGRGIYPRLLQGIMQTEAALAERLWIAYAPENHASGSGIARAGFTAMADLSFDRDGRPALRAVAPGGATAVARVIGLPVTEAPLAPCWRCVAAGKGAMSCPEGQCGCDYQKANSGCAA